MATKRERQDAAGALRDHHGSWCAWCLEYLPRSLADSLPLFEAHHVWQTSELGTLAASADLGTSWVVPVHNPDTRDCHPRGLQPIARAAAQKLVRIATGSDDRLRAS